MNKVTEEIIKKLFEFSKNKSERPIILKNEDPQVVLDRIRKDIKIKENESIDSNSTRSNNK